MRRKRLDWVTHVVIAREQMIECLCKLESMQRTTSIKNEGVNWMRQYRDAESGEFRTLSAQEFLEMWKHYDDDGNGYIEGAELDKLLLDLMTSLNATKETEIVSSKVFDEYKDKFMKAFDDNSNARIEIKELVHFVPIEQPLKDLLLHHNSLKTSVEFMHVWNKYDSDNSGYIEELELQSILRDFYKTTTSRKIEDEKLEEYTRLIFEIFDSNKDGKLQLSEVSRMFPVEENIFVQMKLLGRITNRKINQIFDRYDADRNGFIDGNELQVFLKDLLDSQDKDYDMNMISDLMNTIMNTCDVNNDNQLSKKELKAVLQSFAQRKQSNRCLMCKCNSQ